MKRKKLEADASFQNQFQALRQITSLTHTQCRQVIELLHIDEKKTGARTGQRVQHKYPVSLPALRKATVEVEGKQLRIPRFSLPEMVQLKANSSSFFKECLSHAMRTNDNTLELVVAWDETVPGNVLAPDLRRKAALTYCSFLEMPVLWADTCWFTLSVSRSADIQGIPQGYPRAITAVLEAVLHEVKDGFMVEIDGEPELLRIKQFNIVADADGIRLMTGAKGFAGLKCCFRCSNVVSGAHTNMARHEHISSRYIDKWSLHDRESLQSIQAHLQGIAGKTAREKAETQLGWNLNEMNAGVVWKPALREILPLDNILYDPMHCWASNGLIGQELGYWFAALNEKTTATLQQLKTYCKTCWTSCGIHWVDTDLLLATKLWPQDKDFKGEAAASLNVLPLIVAFSHEVILPIYPCMAPEIKSISALYEVICSWTAAKSSDAAARSKKLAECQQRHVECFVSAYGKRAARPKLHFSMHLPFQFEHKKKALDCFPCERRHRYFKSEVATRHGNLHKFAEFCLLELGEMDAKFKDPMPSLTTKLVGNITECSVLATHCGSQSAVVATGLHHLAVKHCKGQFKICSSTTAVEVMGACKLEDTHFLLCQQLTKKKEMAKGFTCWTTSVEPNTFCLLPSEQISECDDVSFVRVHCTDHEKHVSLLQG